MTFPGDGELLRRGFSKGEIWDLWVSKLEVLSIVNGCGVMLTHPEPGFSDTPEMISFYERFIAYALSRYQPWVGLPKELAEWLKPHSQKLAV